MRPDHPNSGLGAFVLGIIVLVFSAVALSGLVDKRLGNSSNLAETRHEIELETAQLEKLTALHHNRTVELTAAESIAREKSNEFDSLRQALESQELKIKKSELRVFLLLEEIEELERQFSNYRMAHRTNTRNAAVGKSLGNLTLSNGRVYRESIIVKVTDVGLEIRHLDGTARIQAPELDESMHALYQWDSAERLQRLKVEQEQRDAMNEITPEFTPSIPKGDSLTNQTPSLLHDRSGSDSLRENIRAWQLRVSQLRSKHKQALDAIRTGTQGTGPGGLETWRDRADRLSIELREARNQLAVMTAKLFSVSPDDPVFRFRNDHESPH